MEYITVFFIIFLSLLDNCTCTETSDFRRLRGLQIADAGPLADGHIGIDPLLVRVTIVGTFSEEEDGTITKDEIQQISGIPIIDGVETDELYLIELPQIIIDDNKSAAYSGNLFVSITGVEYRDEEIILSHDSVIEVIPDPRIATRSDISSTTGTKTLAMVRVSTIDSTPKDSAEALFEGIFSLDKTNLRTQFRACSFGKLDWVPSSFGVLEVFVDSYVSNFTSGSALVSAAQTTMKEIMGIESAAELGDKVVMCLPPGTGGWVASSGVNHWRAQFNSEWCLSLTATMHET